MKQLNLFELSKEKWKKNPLFANYSFIKNEFHFKKCVFPENFYRVLVCVFWALNTKKFIAKIFAENMSLYYPHSQTRTETI